MGCKESKVRSNGSSTPTLEAVQERDMRARMQWGSRPSPSRQRAIQERMKELDALAIQPVGPAGQGLVENDVDVNEASQVAEPIEAPCDNPLFIPSTVSHAPANHRDSDALIEVDVESTPGN